MSYKNSAAANRDALFGGPPSGGGGGGGGGPKKKTSSSSSATQRRSTSRPTSSTTATTTNARATTLGGQAASTVSSLSSSAPTTTTGANNPAMGRIRSGGRSGGAVQTLTGSAKLAKLKEAEEYRDKAKKAMTKGLFQKPDPIRAATHYRRAAEAYRQCGENRLERLHRIASGDCQLQQDAYSTAALEYTRAAELSAISDETPARKQQECFQLYKNAADAWGQMGEKGKRAECLMKAAMGLRIDLDDEGQILDRTTMTAMEEAVEAHVPDVLNRHSSHRRTGKTTMSFGEDETGEQRNETATEEKTKDAYAHENIQKILSVMLKTGEYECALYVVGALCELLESGGYATISLSRAYATETIIQLALGDIVAADRTFMDVHLQNFNYLNSRECKLAEDLIRAIKTYDHEQLEQCQQDRTLANLDPDVRTLVQTLRVSGMAKKKKKPTTTKGLAATTAMTTGGGMGAGTATAGAMAPGLPPPLRGGAELERKPKSAPPPPVEPKPLEGEELAKALEKNYDELDNIMNDMGLDDSSEEEEEDDDDIDLR